MDWLRLSLDMEKPPQTGPRRRIMPGAATDWSRRDMLRLRRDEPQADGCWRVEIDADNCSDCQACVRICPQRALARTEQARSVIYTLDGSRCNGCGDCSRACAERAVRITRSDQQAGKCEAACLAMAACKGCGDMAAGLIDGLCCLCRQNDMRLGKGQ